MTRKNHIPTPADPHERREALPSQQPKATEEDPKDLGREDSSVVFVGHAAAGTLARQIIDGAKQVNILGKNIPVTARIYTINGFSAHADQAELLAWQKQTDANRTFPVHGDEATMQQFAAKLADTRVEMPEPHQVFEL